MNVAERILNFYTALELSDDQLPTNVRVMNPYADPAPEVAAVIERFYRQYYSDQASRGLILGINPGRFGAGVTGIPFTDSYRLQEFCQIDFPQETRETSSAFVYEVVDAYGGAQAFYRNWFVGAVSPLGFIHLNKKGNWVNYNYYDSKELEKAVRPFIVEQLIKQREICGNPDRCVILGTGKNYQYLQRLNEEEKLFKELTPLEHPRYIMQYKLKSKEAYVAKFLKALT